MGALAGVRLRLVESFSDACDFMRWLGERREILAADTETGGLEWWNKRLRLVQIGDADAGWAIPWELWGGVAKEALERYEDDVVFHNAAFDLRFLEENGVDVRDLRSRTHDTSVMSHVLDSTRLRALKKLSVSLVDKNADAGADALKDAMTQNRWTWDSIPVKVPAYWGYSALDPVLAARLYSKFRPEILANEGYNRIYELEMAVLHILSAMERRGLLIDVEYTEKTRDNLERFEAEMRSYVQERWGISASSNGAVAKRLLEDGASLSKVTKTGNFSVDEEVLSDLAPHFELADCVLKVRKSHKFQASYFEAILRNLHNGRIHPSINPLGARTGRMSVSRPPFQQLPSDSPLVRDCVVAELLEQLTGVKKEARARVEMSLMTFDYDQIELRVLADLAREQSMIDAVLDGVDLHMSNARMIFGDIAVPDLEDLSNPRRKPAKAGAFAKVYGAGPAKLALQLGISVAEASAFMERFDTALSGISGTARHMEQVIRERTASEGRGYVTTKFGRRCYTDRGKEYTGLNYYCQGTAADILKLRIVELDKAGLADYALLPVHDEIIFEAPTKDCPDLMPEIQRVMTDADNFLVPIAAGGKQITRWGDPYRKEDQ